MKVKIMSVKKAMVRMRALPKRPRVFWRSRLKRRWPRMPPVP